MRARTPSIIVPRMILAYFSGALAVGIVLTVVLAVAALIRVFKDPQLGSGGRVLWTLVVLVFPVIGSLVYFGVRKSW